MNVTSLCTLCQAGLKHVCCFQFTGKYVSEQRRCRRNALKVHCRDALWHHVYSQSRIKFRSTPPPSNYMEWLPQPHKHTHPHTHTHTHPHTNNCYHYFFYCYHIPPIILSSQIEIETSRSLSIKSMHAWLCNADTIYHPHYTIEWWKSITWFLIKQSSLRFLT